MFLSAHSASSAVKTDVRGVAAPGGVRACIRHRPRISTLPANRFAARLILVLNLLLIPLAATAQSKDWSHSCVEILWTPTFSRSRPQNASQRSGTVWHSKWKDRSRSVFKNQDHLEFNIAVIARWLTPSWDCHIDIRLAFGEGISCNTSPCNRDTEK